MIDCSITKNYFREKKRMTKNCTISCLDCGLSYCNNGLDRGCVEFEKEKPKEAIEIVQNWSNSHPTETRLDVFRKMFPNCEKDVYGYPSPCPKTLDITFDFDCSGPCGNCLEEFWTVPYESEKE